MITWLGDSLDLAVDNLKAAEDTLEKLDEENYIMNAYIALVLMDFAIEILKSHMGGAE